MAHDVFISYSSKDKAVADATCATLEAKGLRCWIAPRDITPGADWGESIVDAIAASRAFVLLLSANANTSQQIKREVERAVHAALPIIPMRIQDVQPAKSLAYFLSTPHWLDAMTPPLERHLNYLADVLRHILDGAPAPAPPKVKPSVPPWLVDRRVLIGGGAVVLGAVALGLWRGVQSAAPPSFVGKWTAEKVTIDSFGGPGGGAAFATDAFVQAALKGSGMSGSFEVNELGQYRYISAADDTGWVSATKDRITFTSDATGDAKTMAYMLIDAMRAQAMVHAMRGELGDHGLLLNPMAPSQVGLIGKPESASGSPLQKLAGVWRSRSPFKGVAPSPEVALTISANGRYHFRGELDERGIWTAADGKWTRAPQGTTQPISGTYVFDGRNRVTCAAAEGATVWVRAE